MNTGKSYCNCEQLDACTECIIKTILNNLTIIKKDGEFFIELKNVFSDSIEEDDKKKDGIDITKLDWEENFVKILSDNIYHEYTQFEKIKETVSLSNFKKPKDSFWISDWVLEKIIIEGFEAENRNNQMVAKRGSERREISVGSFIFFKRNNEDIRVFRPKYEEGTPEEEGGTWNFIFGKEKIEIDTQFQVRFYFNIKPILNNINIFITEIQEKLNAYSIPFNLKFNDSVYQRADACVLYLEKWHFPIVYNLVRKIYEKNSAFFNEKTPLFTLKIAAGFGFAESGILKSDSFGKSRSFEIATIIKNAFKVKKTLPNTIEKIVFDTLKERYKDLTKFYKNSTSTNEFDYENYI